MGAEAELLYPRSIPDNELSHGNGISQIDPHEMWGFPGVSCFIGTKTLAHVASSCLLLKIHKHPHVCWFTSNKTHFFDSDPQNHILMLIKSEKTRKQ